MRYVTREHEVPLNFHLGLLTVIHNFSLSLSLITYLWLEVDRTNPLGMFTANKWNANGKGKDMTLLVVVKLQIKEVQGKYEDISKHVISSSS